MICVRQNLFYFYFVRYWQDFGFPNRMHPKLNFKKTRKKAWAFNANTFQ